jgi:uncharacterized lipoprotein YddW (UPF0748 family)
MWGWCLLAASCLLACLGQLHEGYALQTARQNVLPAMQSEVIRIDFTDKRVQRTDRNQDITFSQAAFSAKGLGMAHSAAKAVVESKTIRVPIERAEPFLTFTMETVLEDAEMENITLAVRFSDDGENFGAWEMLHEDEDAEREKYQRQNRIFTGLKLLAPSTKAVQYRVELMTSSNYKHPILKRCALHFFSPGATPKEELEALQHGGMWQGRNLLTVESLSNAQSVSKQPSRSVQSLPRPAFVNRVGWGCPTGQTAGTRQGNLTTTNVTHLIIHHSYIPGNDVTDFPAAIRSMWNYHVNTQGWSDVGYNWFIDRNGVLYQGRAWVGTNENVTGAHFCGKNGNTMGVCVIGDYTSVQPSAAAVSKLVDILAYRASTEDIDPLAVRYHANSGQTFNTIVGHRVLSCTSCPGDAFVPLIPNIRTRVQTALNGTPPPSLSVSTTSLNLGSAETGTTRTATYTVSFANLTAPISLTTGGSNAGLFGVSVNGSAFGSSASIPANATSPVTVTVRYAPTAAGSHTASIAHASGSLSATVNLSGTATAPSLPPPTLTTSVSSLNFGALTTGQTQTATYTVSYANLTAPISFSLSGANATQFTVSTNGSTFGSTASLAANRVNVATSAYYVVGAQGRFIGTALPGAVIGATVDGFAIANNIVADANGRFTFTYTFGSAGAARQLVVTATINGSTASTSRTIEVRSSGTAAADPTVYPASISPATITVRYAPSAAGSHSATLTQSSSSGGTPISASVSLSGSASPPFPPAPTASGPKREYRAVWIATVSNIDWPLSSSDTPAKQQQDLVNILENHKANGINAVMLQVRPSADALYARGRREPWSAVLTGTQGQNPGWDPLQFAIDEAHKRGMELHAWLNPFRSVPSSSTVVSSTHISQTQPSWHLTYTSPYKLLNPGLPAVRQYVASVVMDIVRNYAVDGIHFDDYFYPYGGTTDQDQATFAAHNRGFTDIAAWRRDNVNLFVRMVRDSINAVKPFLKFGISPFGIWKSGTPAGITGLSAYDVIYCDATAWLQAGTVDYVAPQLYWKFGGGQDYAALLNWWVSQGNGRHIYSGNGAYRLSESTWTANDITSQLRYNRTNGTSGAPGAVLFSSKDVTNNTKGIRDSLRTALYSTIALPPVMAWKDATPPNAPVNLSASASATAITLTWQAPPAASDGDGARYYLVYRFLNGRDAVNTNSHQFILAKTSATSFVDNTAQAGFSYTYVVSALDKLSNESNPNPRAENVSLGGGTLLAAAKPDAPVSFVEDNAIPTALALAADSARVLAQSAVQHSQHGTTESEAYAGEAPMPEALLNNLRDGVDRLSELRVGEALVSPNPVIDQLLVNARVAEQGNAGKAGDGYAELVVRSVVGHQVLAHPVAVDASGAVTTSIHTADLPAGMYMLEIRTRKGVARTRFVKQ